VCYIARYVVKAEAACFVYSANYVPQYIARVINAQCTNNHCCCCFLQAHGAVVCQRAPPQTRALCSASPALPDRPATQEPLHPASAVSAKFQSLKQCKLLLQLLAGKGSKECSSQLRADTPKQCPLACAYDSCCAPVQHAGPHANKHGHRGQSHHRVASCNRVMRIMIFSHSKVTVQHLIAL
jgi:hypothetical protein